MPGQKLFSLAIPESTKLLAKSSIHNLIKAVQIYQADSILNDTSIQGIINFRKKEKSQYQQKNTKASAFLNIDELITESIKLVDKTEERSKRRLTLKKSQLEDAKAQLNTELTKLQSFDDATKFLSGKPDMNFEIKKDSIIFGGEEIIIAQLEKINQRISTDEFNEQEEFVKALITQYKSKISYLDRYIEKLNSEITKIDKQEEKQRQKEIEEKVKLRELKQKEHKEERNPFANLPDGPSNLPQKRINPYEIIVKLMYNVVRSKKYWKKNKPGSFLTGGRPRHIDKIYTKCQESLEGAGRGQLTEVDYQKILINVIRPELKKTDKWDKTIIQIASCDPSLLSHKAIEFSHLGVSEVKRKSEQDTDSEEAMKSATEAMEKLEIIAKLLPVEENNTSTEKERTISGAKASESRMDSQISQRTVSESRISVVSENSGSSISSGRISSPVSEGLQHMSMFSQNSRSTSKPQAQVQTQVQRGETSAIHPELAQAGLQTYTREHAIENHERYARKRHENVLKIKSDTTDILEDHKELNTLVKKQGDGVNEIDANVQSAKNHLEVADKNLTKAAELQESSEKREKQIYGFFVDVTTKVITGKATQVLGDKIETVEEGRGILSRFLG